MSRLSWRRHLQPLRRLKLPPFPVSFANQGIGMTHRQLLAVKTCLAGKALLVVYLASVLAAAIPVQIGYSTWFLGLCSSLVNNGPILVLALLALNLAAYWDPSAKVNRDFARPLLLSSRLGTAVFGVVVVMQLVAAGFFCEQVLSQNSAQLRGLERQLGVVASDVEAAQDPAQLNLILQRLGTLPISPGSAQIESLPVIKQQVLKDLKSNLLSARTRLQQQTRQRFFALATDSVRVVVTAAALAAACLGFAQWNGIFKHSHPGLSP